MNVNHEDKIGLWVETEGRYRGDLVIDMSPTWNLHMLALPGARFDRHTRRYTIPWTWNSLLSIKAMAAKIKWSLAPDEQVRDWGRAQGKAWGELSRAAKELHAGDKTEKGYYLHQVDAANWLLAAPETNVGRLLLDETGCLAGDTLINVNRAGKGSRMTIEHIVKRMAGESMSGPGWDPRIPTMVARADGGIVRLGRLDKAWFSGLKETFTLTTETGREIRASAEHPFSTPEGWVKLGDLSVGALLHVNVGRSRRGKTSPKAYYRQTFGMEAHPNRVRRNAPRNAPRGWKFQWAVAEHRLVAEAGMNGLDPQVFIDKIRGGDVSGLVFLGSEFDVHHVDRDTLNNRPENLQILTVAEHHALHAREGKVNHVLEQVGTERLVQIARYGDEPTYDIRMADEPHNFMANGFVVHNSGKTISTIAAIVEGKIPGPMLVVSLESAMETAWAKDFATWAPHLRVAQVVGTITARRKTLAKLKDGEIDVAIIGHSNLKSHTRFESYGSTGLRKCIKCGGPQLTSGKVDDKGKPLPDIDYHLTAAVKQVGPEKWRAYCEYKGCTWLGNTVTGRCEAEAEMTAHQRTGKKITELTEAQCQKHHKELNDIPLQLIIVDEIHRAMNPQSQFTQAMWGVANYSADGGRVPNHRRWGLSGTIVSKRSDQAWSPLHWISPQGYPTKGSWTSYFCLEERGWDGFPRCERFQPDKVEEFQKIYSAVTRRVLKSQVINLPPRIRWGSLERRVDMGRAQRAQYVSMRDEMLLAVESGLITVQNAAAAAGRLSMLASGCGKPDPNNRPGGPQKMLIEAPSCKLDAIIDDFRAGEFDGAQIGMTFASSQVLYMVRQGLIDAKILKPGEIVTIAGQMPKDEVDRAIRNFQGGKARVVMLTYAKGGASITLTAASIVLCVQRDWNPINNLQGLDRFYRIGSERHESINVFDYVTRGTNEIAQLRRLDQNAQTLEEVVQDRKRLAEWFS